MQGFDNQLSGSEFPGLRPGHSGSTTSCPGFPQGFQVDNTTTGEATASKMAFKQWDI